VSDAAEEIRAAESALYDAMIALDYPALRQMLSPALVYIHSTGVAEGGQRYLAALAEGLYEYETIASHDTRLHVEGNVAILNGVVDMLVGARGKAKELIHLLFVLIWIRQEGRWQLEFRQATRIP
jgi:ketosteroid isomerase-like protein